MTVPTQQFRSWCIKTCICKRVLIVNFIIIKYTSYFLYMIMIGYDNDIWLLCHLLFVIDDTTLILITFLVWLRGIRSVHSFIACSIFITKLVGFALSFVNAQFQRLRQCADLQEHFLWMTFSIFENVIWNWENLKWNFRHNYS